jgi:HK97 family phage major capsid protein
MVLQSDANLLPIEWAREVIKEMAQASAVLQLSRRVQMSTRQSRMPAAAALAGAYWVGNTANDFTSLKQQTNAEWDAVNLNVEELAVLVAIPDAYEQDNAFPVWDETRPQVVEAMGAALDAAALFGVNKPSTWPTAIMPSIVAAGQTVEQGTTDDLAADIALGAQGLEEVGFNTTGFAVKPGFSWQLVGLRSEQGIPIYQTNLPGPVSKGLYGYPMQEVKNGAWDSDEALVIHGDWGKSIVGIRQDITFTRHDSGIISDGGGNVVFNAMQQDSTIWRAVFRVAWARANPVTRLEPSAALRFPFGAIVPAGS